MDTQVTVCSCDEAQLTRDAIKGRKPAACPLHRPEVPHGAALALNSPQLAANIAHALGGTVTDNTEENF
ncbi:hypothetical protein ABKW28_10740 [Nocardioides sp. 31GB23]|uniref:hypothetical protein n=1 Tax=Nocardioides sp. 31GB23 TaxID=3156065 RepID=UPI0032AE9875